MCLTKNRLAVVLALGPMALIPNSFTQAADIGYTLTIEDLGATGITVLNNQSNAINTSGPLFTLKNDSLDAKIVEFSFSIGDTSFMFDFLQRVGGLVGPVVDYGGDLSCSVLSPTPNLDGDFVGTDVFQISCIGFDPGDVYVIGTADVDTDGANNTIGTIVFWDNGNAANSTADVHFSTTDELVLSFPENQNVTSSCPSGVPFSGTTCLSVTVSDLAPGLPQLVCLGFAPPMDREVIVRRVNRIIPLRFVLLDEFGDEVTDLDILSAPVFDVDFDASVSSLLPEQAIDLFGPADSGNQFAFEDGTWQHRLATAQFSSPGTYTVHVKSGDPDEYNVDPSCSGVFVVSD